jgi:hypothetical protein
MPTRFAHRSTARSLSVFRGTVLTLLLLASARFSPAQNPAHRPPAVPLVASDPYFSVWSMADKLTDAPTKHWSEAPQPMVGLARIDGHVFRWMGTDVGRPGELAAIPAMQQISLTISALHTRYRFLADGVQLTVTFFTPSFPADLDVLSRPVTYLSWSARSANGSPHNVELLLDVSPMIAVNDRSQLETWARFRAPGLSVMRVGTRDQDYLHQSGDRIRIDWGYFNLCVPDGAAVSSEMSVGAIGQFVRDGHLRGTDDLGPPAPAESSHGSAAHLAVAFPLGQVGASPIARHVLLAYTETYAIEYLGRRLHPYWQRNGMTENAMLTAAEHDYAALEQRGGAFDRALDADMQRTGGADYAYLTALLFRQTLAAHKLVADVDGTPMLFPKENDSNGCIGTVDVIYPSSPFFLLFNAKLLQAQLEPLMRYAAMPSRWHFPFAPHDLGQYPLADGQVYGGGESNEVDQMPVEESGNLILMVAALGRSEGNWDFARRFMPQLTAWAAYLAEKGMDPENQLSTDDFAGHLAHNTNLSIKAIEALGAFVEIARGMGDESLAKHYEEIVRPMPAKWEQMALDGDHYRLAFDQPNTWSQKYNLVWDRLLDLHLFSPTIAETEWSFYARNMQPDGLPLDNRATFTKLDWEVWTATLGDDRQSADLVHRLVTWLDTTPSRVPATDWYDTITGKQQGFQARSVVGGVFLKALLDPEVAAHWKTTGP